MPFDTNSTPSALLSSPLWRDAELWRLWCWTRLTAARKARTVLCGGVPVRVRAGEAAASLERILAATGLSPSSLRHSLALGKSIGVLTFIRTPWAIRISIVN